MHYLRHAIPYAAHRLRLLRRLNCRRRLSLTALSLTLIWVFALFVGERVIFWSHIDTCDWLKWEEWPQEAMPHHLVLIADPQLVDPHTYPGRPWPLNVLTERYTDLYMGRNFRLINAKLNPDSIVFLGDLFDGGREWATKEWDMSFGSSSSITTEATTKSKGSQDEIKKTHRKAIEFMGESDASLNGRAEEQVANEFWPGEGGRWVNWRMSQWYSEYRRFGRMFSTLEQLYPRYDRNFLAAAIFSPSKVNIANGYNNNHRDYYGTVGRKQRRIITSLPGNHDLGFGSGVQLSVRNRYHSHFGETNEVYTLGNHTFISVDTPSLSASSEFTQTGETSSEQRERLQRIWLPTFEFLEDLGMPHREVMAQELANLFPDNHTLARRLHKASDLDEETVRYDEAIEARSSLSQPGVDLNASSSFPVILLSHIPLFRNPETNCGHLRERGSAIQVSRGYQYQNVLTEYLSALVVSRVVRNVGKVVHAFSGDDHDYCDITHRIDVGSEDARGTTRLETFHEITVKSFSWAMGVRQPGFQLVSLWNPINETGHSVSTMSTTIQSKLCILPDQLSIFIAYGMLCGITLAVLLVRAVVVTALFKSRQAAEDAAVRSAIPPDCETWKPDGKSHDITINSSYVQSKGRHRTSSTSTSTNPNHNSINTLGVQRSYNARTRSVSPGTPNNILNTSGTKSHWLMQNNHAGSLMEKSAFSSSPLLEQENHSSLRDLESQYKQDDDSDEGFWDSQAKCKRLPRHQISWIRQMMQEFTRGLMLVALPSILFYAWLMANG